MDERSDDRSGGDPQAEELSALVANVCEADRQIAEAVVRAGRLAGSGVAERVEGQPLELLLATTARLTHADRKTLIAAGEALVDMPAVQALFLDGQMSWGVVRAITRDAKQLSRADRQWLDERLEATLRERGDLRKFEPDELITAFDRALDECRRLADVERDHTDAVEESFLAVQRDFAGGGVTYGRWDPELCATVVGALDAAARPPARDGDGRPQSTGASGWTTTTRSHQLAEALGRICAEWAGGHTVADTEPATGGPLRHGDVDDGAAATPEPTADAAAGPVTGRRARTLITVNVDVGDVTPSAAGVLDLPVRGPLPRLTAAAVEALACSAVVRAVLFDGARPLAATRKTDAGDVPDDTRAAVEARDQGCRWPGCQAPLAHTEIHHLAPRSEGGSHDPSNLLCLCRLDHQIAHAFGWRLRLDPDTGELIGVRDGTEKWTTLPRNTSLARAEHPGSADHHDDPDPEDGDGDRAPPERDPPRRHTHPPADPHGDSCPYLDEDGDPLPF